VIHHRFPFFGRFARQPAFARIEPPKKTGCEQKLAKAAKGRRNS
jgi:hypothetical protein